jgi:large repetitive protein
MSQENVELVRAGIDAYNRRELDALLEHGAPDFVFDLSRAAGPVHGVRLSRDGAGVAIEKGNHNLVARDVVIEPRTRGISLGVDFADGTSIGGVDNLVRRNVVKRSGGNGFLVNKGLFNKKGTNVLRRNIAIGAKGDGFRVESRATKLAKNRAKHNADLGIQARRGVIDGGGNRASGNGDQRQCVHVRCR